MKACKNCTHGDGFCDKQGFCVYCNLGSAMGEYPVIKDTNDCCDEFDDREGADNG